jgi:translation initiation factor IF-3
MGKRDMAFELVKRYIALLEEVNISKEPRLEGRVIRAVVAKKK